MCGSRQARFESRRPALEPRRARGAGSRRSRRPPAAPGTRSPRAAANPAAPRVASRVPRRERLERSAGSLTGNWRPAGEEQPQLRSTPRRVLTMNAGGRRSEACLPGEAAFVDATTSVIGSQTFALTGNPNRAGITPTMVRGEPFTRTVEPTTAASARKRPRQRSSAITMTAGEPGRASVSRSGRPRAGATRSSSNVFGVMVADGTRSAAKSASAPRLTLSIRKPARSIVRSEARSC